MYPKKTMKLLGKATGMGKSVGGGDRSHLSLLGVSEDQVFANGVQLSGEDILLESDTCHVFESVLQGSRRHPKLLGKVFGGQLFGAGIEVVWVGPGLLIRGLCFAEGVEYVRLLVQAHG